jgi:hypothetical protein
LPVLRVVGGATLGGGVDAPLFVRALVSVTCGTDSGMVAT